jgi:hypothetical protein
LIGRHDEEREGADGDEGANGAGCGLNDWM